MTKDTLNTKIKNEIKEDADFISLIRRSDLAHHFKGCMVKKGLKIADIAARLDVSVANISRMLNGKQNLTLDNIHAIADALQENLVITIESNWQEDYMSNFGKSYFCSDDNWHLSDMHFSPSLNAYRSIISKAANDEVQSETSWLGCNDFHFLEQRA